MAIEKIKKKVYKIVCQVPKGKVTTYGTIGKKLSISPRLVGHALHLNDSGNVPCHRVVDRNGRIAPTFAFGGYKEHRKRLEDEGISFIDRLHVKKENIIFNL